MSTAFATTDFIASELIEKAQQYLVDTEGLSGRDLALAN